MTQRRFTSPTRKPASPRARPGWPCDVLTLHPTEASIRQAIQEGPYGRCVYFCDNDVVDHQVVNLEMEGGLTVNFTMSAFTAGGGRYTNFMGAMGDMIGRHGQKYRHRHSLRRQAHSL